MGQQPLYKPRRASLGHEDGFFLTAINWQQIYSKLALITFDANKKLY